MTERMSMIHPAPKAAASTEAREAARSDDDDVARALRCLADSTGTDRVFDAATPRIADFKFGETGGLRLR